MRQPLSFDLWEKTSLPKTWTLSLCQFSCILIIRSDFLVLIHTANDKNFKLNEWYWGVFAYFCIGRMKNHPSLLKSAYYVGLHPYEGLKWLLDAYECEVNQVYDIILGLYGLPHHDSYDTY